MNVSFSGLALKEECRVSRTWFDASSRKLYAELNGGLANATAFDRIPDADFDSRANVIAFSVGMKGAVVICHHVDGQETWLPADIWLPGAFTPAAKHSPRKKISSKASALA